MSRHSNRIACTETRKFRHSNNNTNPESRSLRCSSTFQYHRYWEYLQAGSSIMMLFSFVQSFISLTSLFYPIVRTSFRVFSSRHRHGDCLFFNDSSHKQSELTKPGLAICCILISRICVFTFRVSARRITRARTTKTQTSFHNDRWITSILLVDAFYPRPRRLIGPDENPLGSEPQVKPSSTRNVFVHARDATRAEIAHARTYTRPVCERLSFVCKFVYPDVIIAIPYLAVSCGVLAFASRDRGIDHGFSSSSPSLRLRLIVFFQHRGEIEKQPWFHYKKKGNKEIRNVSVNLL